MTLFVNIQIKLGEAGWRERYYEEKFGARTPDQIEEIRRDVVSIVEVPINLPIHDSLMTPETVAIITLFVPTPIGNITRSMFRKIFLL